MADRIMFKVNGVERSVGSEVSSDVTLLDYLRNTLELRGTKYMCREGGCGACTVNATTSPGTACKTVNSCLVSITSCNDWKIKTIEALGDKRVGYHPLQTAVAENNATQCGYCTPGWVMSMNGLLESTDNNITMLDIEKSFGSNICRCTGYRPLAECFKKFGKDAPKSDIVDIENLTLCSKKIRHRNGSASSEEDGFCVIRDNDLLEPTSKRIVLKDGKIWCRPGTLTDVIQILKHVSNESDYMLVAGNTAKGAYPIFQYPSILIDISQLPELQSNYFDQNLVVGGAITLTIFLDILKDCSNQQYFTYLSKLYDHISLVAHIPVRNIGTIAGNLMIKHKHNSFQSDIFLLFETVGAQLKIVDSWGLAKTFTMQDFLKVSMNGKIITKVLLPPLSNRCKLTTFKIMPRSQSAHGIVNAGFLYGTQGVQNTVTSARIVYGGLSPKFTRALATETFLIGKSLFSNSTLQAALRVLDAELIVEENPPEPSVAYRRYLAKSLFFKGLLTLNNQRDLGQRYRSGAVRLHESRGLSDGKQIFYTDPTKWPLTEPIQKLEAKSQSSGEAIYTEDLPSFVNEVFAAFVLSNVAVATIDKIDASHALKVPGVIAFYTAKDIPGLNSFTPADSPLYISNEEVLASGTVKYYHQPIGIIVAECEQTANRAAKLVNVMYSNVKKPVLDVKEAKNEATRNSLLMSVNATNPGEDVYKVIKGNSTFYGQYHFTIETLVNVTKPTEEGLEVHSATQWFDGTHVMISRALLLDQNKIDVYVKRVGGAYGIKISRSIQSAVASSLVCMKLNRPCRFIQSLTTNMEAVGKRLSYSNDYEVAVNRLGVIQYLNHNTYEDNGYMRNETLSILAFDVYYNCYDIAKFNYRAYDTITDKAKNTWCRSPGTLEAIAAAECIMERISYELSLDPVTVRLANLDRTKFSEMETMVEQLKTDADYVTRRAAVDRFNTENRWKKRGLRFAFTKWTPLGAQRLDLNMSVFHGDGTIVITHGGVEMGQGINTKLVQCAAYFLKVPVNNIQVKTNNTNIAPNCFISGGSLTGQSALIALRRCCDQLLARLEPIRATLSDPTWKELIKAAYDADIDLQAHGFVSMKDGQEYNIFGMVLTEVEIDCLTGEFEILQVDIIQDVGLSISPEIDIGQVEGGFIMAVGYWTSEKLVYEPDTGKMLTNRTWHYHVPGMRDIPQKINIYFKKKSYSNELILGSKATGEPSTCAAIGITFALREAIAAARQESGIPTTEWFQVDGPFTTEAVAMETKTRTESFAFI